MLSIYKKERCILDISKPALFSAILVVVMMMIVVVYPPYPGSSDTAPSLVKLSSSLPVQMPSLCKELLVTAVYAKAVVLCE